MLWESASRCPCERILTNGGIVQATGEFKTECPECGGLGVIYHSDLQITALFEDATVNPDRFAFYGETASGMASVTTLPEHTPGFLDRFTLIDNVMIYAETRLKRATVERLRWPITSREVVIGNSVDPTEPETIAVSVVYCRKAGADGSILDTVLEVGTDFVVTDDGEIDWTLGEALGTAPAQDARYSVQYYGHPTYIVRDFPFTIRDTYVKKKTADAAFVPLPRRAMCWLEYLGNSLSWPGGA